MPSLESQSGIEICEASGRFAKVTDKITVKVGTLGVISLLLCNDCVSKFSEVTQTC